jgi:hypothetical protein
MGENDKPRKCQSSKFKCQKKPEAQMANDKTYDLEERTAQFGESIIDFVKTLPKNVINNQLISHIVRSCTSIGTNYTRPVR